MPDTTIRLVSLIPSTRLPFEALATANDDDKGDPKKRIGFFVRTVGNALTRVAKDHGPAADLTLVIAPEWYFRRPVAHGRYTRAEMNGIVAALCTASRGFEKTLLIAGSIYFADDAGKSKIRRKHRGWNVYNVAPAISGGRLLCLNYKVSEADNLQSGETWGMPAIGSWKGLAAEAKTLATLKDGFGDAVTFGAGLFADPTTGLRFATETCADHVKGFVRDAAANRDATVHVHVEVACGSGFLRGNCPVGIGGYFAIVDGGTDNERRNRFGSNQLFKRRAAGGKSTTSAGFVEVGPQPKNEAGEAVYLAARDVVRTDMGDGYVIYRDLLRIPAQGAAAVDETLDATCTETSTA